MLLAIDVGNTHSVFAVCNAEEVRASWRISTNSHRTEDEYAAMLLSLLKQHQWSARDITASILSSVVPDTVFPLRRCCEKYFGGLPIVVGQDVVDLGIDVRIDNPRELGADRLVNAVAAMHQYSLPLIVVDFGTATTFDVVNKDAAYIGGVIAPGVNLSLEALQKAAAKLHGVRIRQPEKAIGTNTTTAMQSGIYFGYLGLVNGILEQLVRELGTPATVIATGGLAELYARDNPAIHHVDGELTVHGLQLIYSHNKETI